MKPVRLDCLLEIVNKFEQEWGHKLGMKRTWKKKKDPFASGLTIDGDINL
jgi:hypothetical protein